MVAEVVDIELVEVEVEVFAVELVFVVVARWLSDARRLK